MELKLLKLIFDFATCIFDKYKEIAIELFNDILFLISLFYPFSVPLLEEKIENFLEGNKEEQKAKEKNEEGFLIVQLSYILKFFGLKSSDLHYLFFSKEYEETSSEKFLKVFSSALFKDTLNRLKKIDNKVSRALLSENLNFSEERKRLINSISQKIDLYEFKDRDLLFLFYHA